MQNLICNLFGETVEKNILICYSSHIEKIYFPGHLIMPFGIYKVYPPGHPIMPVGIYKVYLISIAANVLKRRDS